MRVATFLFDGALAATIRVNVVPKRQKPKGKKRTLQQIKHKESNAEKRLTSTWHDKAIADTKKYSNVTVNNIELNEITTLCNIACSLGLTLTAMPRDNRCLYHAITTTLIELKIIPNTQTSAQTKTLILDYINNNQHDEIFDSIRIPDDQDVTQGNVDTYLKKKRTDSERGGQQEITAE